MYSAIFIASLNINELNILKCTLVSTGKRGGCTTGWCKPKPARLQRDARGARTANHPHFVWSEASSCGCTSFVSRFRPILFNPLWNPQQMCSNRAHPSHLFHSNKPRVAFIDTNFPLLENQLNGLGFLDNLLLFLSPLNSLLSLSGHLVPIKLTPNRAYCTFISGLSRRLKHPFSQ